MSKRVLKNILKNGNEYEVGNIKLYVITEDMVTVETDTTKGVSPYNTSYGYTNITIDENSGIKWKEGAFYHFVVNTEMVVASAYRNVRVRIGTGGDWIPMKNRANTILAGSSYMTKGRTQFFAYKTVYESGGALHLDIDTSYSAMSVSEGKTGTATSGRIVRADYLKQIIEYHAGNLHDDTKADVSDVLTKDNTTQFTPSGDYQPATKKYVDDNIPTVNDSTITITQGGTNIDNFSTNQATNKTIALRGDIYLTQDEYDALPSSKETDGNNYHIIDASGTSKRLYSVGATAPENPTQGDLWYDTTEDKFKSYNGTEWEEIGGSSGTKYANIDILVVGGGGGAGEDYSNSNSWGSGGGGGGGGYIYKPGYLISSDGPLCYNVLVGGGGGHLSKGGNSCFDSLVAYGGGGGWDKSCGGSGGGGGYSQFNSCNLCHCGGNGTAGQGNKGGNGATSSGRGGGGGGAATAGCNSTSNSGGNGGDGCLNDISGEAVYYSGGGGGSGYKYCCWNGGYGGCGGGNAAMCVNGVVVGPETPACYGGGGGANWGSNGTTNIGCPGQQGVVYVRYKTDGSCGIKPLSYGGCKYTCGDYTIHKFDQVGVTDTFIPVFK